MSDQATQAPAAKPAITNADLQSIANAVSGAFELVSRAINDIYRLHPNSVAGSHAHSAQDHVQDAANRFGNLMAVQSQYTTDNIEKLVDGKAAEGTLKILPGGQGG